MTSHVPEALRANARMQNDGYGNEEGNGNSNGSTASCSRLLELNPTG